MKNVIFLLIAAACFGCTTTSYFTDEINPVYAEKYADQLEPDARLVGAGYHYTIEKTHDSSYLLKVYFPETEQMTQRVYCKDWVCRIKSGNVVEWNDYGDKLLEGSYHNNKRTGFWKYYQGKDNRLRGSGNYVNDQEEGLWKGFYPSGALMEEKTYVRGQLQGTYKKYDEAGNLLEKGEYRNGKLIELEKTELARAATPDTLEQAVAMQTEELPFLKRCAHIADPAERKACSDRVLLGTMMANMHYPEMAYKNRVQGLVVVSFVIEKNGNISNALIPRGLCQSIKDDCYRLLERMPEWSPGRKNGEPVRVLFNLPLKFAIE